MISFANFLKRMGEGDENVSSASKKNISSFAKKSRHFSLLVNIGCFESVLFQPIMCLSLLNQYVSITVFIFTLHFSSLTTCIYAGGLSSFSFDGKKNVNSCVNTSQYWNSYNFVDLYSSCRITWKASFEWLINKNTRRFICLNMK